MTMIPSRSSSLLALCLAAVSSMASAQTPQTMYALEVADSIGWTRETEVLGDPGDNRCTGSPFEWAANNQNNAGELFVFNCEPVIIPPGMTVTDVFVDVLAVYQDGSRGPLQLEVKVPGFMDLSTPRIRRERRCIPPTSSGSCFWRFNENNTSPNGISIYGDIVNVFGGAENFEWSLVHTLDILVSRRDPGCVANTSNLKVKAVRLVAEFGPDCDGDGVPDAQQMDSDGDGTIDNCDGCPNDPNKTAPGACGCNSSDMDTDGDGTADCDDGCPTDPLKTEPGDCGCNVSDVDSDGDMVPDCFDLCPGFDDRIDCNNNSIPDACEILSGMALDLNDNGVPDECDPPLFVSFCFCAANSPCNNPDPTAGCRNGSFFGASIAGTGSASIGANDLTLTMSGLPQNQFGLFFMGDAELAPVTFGNGQRCVGGNLWRFPVVQANGSGVSTLPGIVGESLNFPTAGRIMAGQTWSFQGWFRDGAGPCGAGFNTTNALRVEFVL